MGNKCISLVMIILFIWASTTYVLILHYSSKVKENKDTFLLQMKELKNNMNHLLLSNEKLLQTLNNKYFNQHYSKNSSLTLKNSDEFPNPMQKNPAIRSKEDDIETGSNILDLSGNVMMGKSPVIAVLVISCNRITVKRCLDQLLKFRPNVKQFPIVVSQDCNHRETMDMIKKYEKEIIYIKQPNQEEIEVPPKEKKFTGYFKIARHYGWALNNVFYKFGFEAAIVVEDDLDISPDFFEYFLGTFPILNTDSSLWCVSAWNDNGKPGLINLKKPYLLYRTDFFPGLGWMLTRKLWEELSPKWPKAYWDDWIRQPEQRKNRSCIRPEISRTRTFGKIGVSNGMFFEKHLQFIKLNEYIVPFTKMNLTYLIKKNYDTAFFKNVYQSKEITYSELIKNNNTFANAVRIQYNSKQSYRKIAKKVGLMDDFKSGVPRTGYQGVVTFFYKGQRVYLAPSTSSAG